MKKTQAVLLTILASISLLFVGTGLVHADSANFSVNPIIGENQLNKSASWFDLLLKPGQSQTLKFELINGSNKPVNVNTTFGTAYTGSAGYVGYTPDSVKPDPSLKINLEKYVELPKQTKIPAHSQVTVSATVNVPNITYKGVIAGGFNFQESDKDPQVAKSKSEGVSITNDYRYVVGLVVHESTDVVSPTLSLGEVKADQVNSRNVITAHLTNSAMSYLMDMNTNAEVTKYNDKKVKYNYSNAQMKMAPNSNFNLAIPVSIQGVLNGKQSEPLTPGKYHLHMTVYGQKNDQGQYTTSVAGQMTKYQYRWVFDKDFTITGAKANSLNQKDPTVDHSINWLLILAIVIIVLLLFIIFLLLKRRKKDDDKEAQEA